MPMTFSSCRARVQNLLIPILSGLLVMAASMANFLRYNHYPILSREVGLVFLGLVLLSVMMGILYSRQGGAGRSVLEALLILLVVDQNAGHSAYAIVAAIFAGGITLFLRRPVLPYFGTAALVMLIVGSIGIGQQVEARGMQVKASARPGDGGGAGLPPAVLHIILDAHIGTEGLPAGNPNTPRLRAMLTTFYRSHGFRLFGHAYGEHFRTANSIPQILNFGETQPQPENRFAGRSVRRNAYFDLLKRQGYRITVYQSGFLNYCDNPAVVRCVGYSEASLDPLLESPLSIRDRAELIAVRFALLSPIVESLGGDYLALAKPYLRRGHDLPEFHLGNGGKTSALNASAAFEDLIAALRHARPGEAYFAHILSPHAPYSLDPTCRPQPGDDWIGHHSGSTIRREQDAYFDQIRCVTSQVDAAIAAIQASPAGRHAIIVVHGDHGSRITEVDPMMDTIDAFSRDDMIAGFSTLFAVRADGIAPGYDTTPRAAAEILASLARSGFRAVPADPVAAAPTVFLDNRLWIPQRRVPLVTNW